MLFRSTKKPVSTPAAKQRKAPAPTRRLSLPPPPGRPSPRGVSGAVRPEDDPFLAAYLVCTKSTGGGRSDGGKNRTSAAREPRGQGRIRRWAELGLVGLSCKSGDGAVVQSMVRLAKLPELDPRDD